MGLMALIAVLPNPFAKLRPARAMMRIGPGLVFRDGVAAVLGQVRARLAPFVTAGPMPMAWVWGIARVMRRTSV
jgi:hypothetical protein